MSGLDVAIIKLSLKLISVHGKDDSGCHCDVGSSVFPGLCGSVKENWKRIYEAAIINELSTAQRPAQPIDTKQMRGWGVLPFGRA